MPFSGPRDNLFWLIFTYVSCEGSKDGTAKVATSSTLSPGALLFAPVCQGHFTRPRTRGGGMLPGSCNLVMRYTRITVGLNVVSDKLSGAKGHSISWRGVDKRILVLGE